MTWYNWLIVILPFAGVLYMAYHTRKYIRSVPDFLAGGRVCGRYLLAETDANKSAEILNRIEQIAKEEIENVRNTIPLVEYDSALGYEPSMDYVADKAHLEWKIRQLMSVLSVDIPNYRKGIATASEIENGTSHGAI